MSVEKPLDEHSLMKKAIAEIRNLRAKVEDLEREKTEPIAVVGMSCRFPQSDNPAAFWNLLARGGDAISEVPKDRWDSDRYYDADPDAPGKMYTKWGGFLQEIDGFSPSFFGISPREAASMDPQQRLLLEVSWEALENAGISLKELSTGQVGVFMGVGATDYAELEVLEGSSAIDTYNGTGAAFSVASGRLSYFLGVRGPSVAIDTACSSSLASVHLALTSLRNGESNVALAGGVNLMMSPDALITLCKARMLSPDGRCKTFDAAANGYARGEGCGVLVLKRLSNALADNDNILALLRGSAVNHNGRSGGLTVPSGPAQEELIRQALRNSGLQPDDVSYVEAHGTGTAVGDPIEVEALAHVFAGRRQPLLIGSVKSNVGHLEWAAGVCGLIKMILSMRHGEIPPSLHFNHPNPRLDWKNLPLRVVTEPTAWPEGQRIGGVSSFGFGGTNAHVLVEAATSLPHPPADCERPAHIFTLSAKTDEALREMADRYAHALVPPAPGNVADICHTTNAGRSHFEHRIATVIRSTNELQKHLEAVAAGVKSAAVQRRTIPAASPAIAMLFTGQGSQYTGMGRELFETQPGFRRTLERCDEILRDLMDRPLLEVLYPTVPDFDETNQLIHQTAYTQPALFALEYALAELWRSWGVRPQTVLGHSVGEYVAACVAGVFGLEDGLKLIAARGSLMQSLPGIGSMAAVRASEEQVGEIIAGYAGKVSIAALNSPEDVVISGERQAVDAVTALLAERGAVSQPLVVSHAFHSPLMDPILNDFEEIAKSVRYSAPGIGLISNVTGALAGNEVTEPSYWVRHLRGAVRFASGMKTLESEGCTAFLEVGPNPTLLGMGRKCVQPSNALWLPSLRSKRGDWQQLLESLGALFVSGADIDWKGFDQPYSRHKVELPTYPFERQHFGLPKSAARNRKGRDSLRPLVDSIVRSPVVKETILTTSFSVAAFPYLTDHRVFGQVVAPAAAYVAMILNGASALGQAACRLEDVVFVAPLMLAETGECTLQAVLEPDGSFRVISFDADTATEVTTHATGQMTQPAANRLPAVDLAQIQKRCTDSIDLEALAARIIGLEFGPSFQWIDSLQAGSRETIARLRMPRSLESTDGYWLHPGLIDACFQVAGSSLSDAGDEVWLAFGLNSLEITRPPGGPVWWCHSQQIGESMWDIRLLDASGATVAQIQGFEVRRAPRSAVFQRRMADWLYRLEWRPQPLQVSGHSTDAGDWLIVDCGRMSNELAERLRSQGQGVVVAGAGEIATLLLNSGVDPCRGVVYPCGESTVSPLPGAAEDVTVDMLKVVQALTRSPGRPRFYIVTHGSQAVAGSEMSESGLTQSPVWGFARTLALEYPDLRCTCVDLSPQPGIEELDALIGELPAHSAESQVAYRAGQRYVARLARHRDARKPGPLEPFRLQLADYGSPDQIRMVPLTRRAPGPGEVEMEVKACAMNFRDVLVALGLLKDHYKDFLKIDRAEDVRLGFDCAGTIVAVGDGVEDFKLGDEVMSSAPGSFASFLTLPRAEVVHKPTGLSFEAASAIPTVFLTAHYGLLQLAQLKAGERVLIHSAAGGVGQAAVQLAQAVGAEIFATASPGKWAFLTSQGIPHVMNSRTLDFADEIQRWTGGEGVDVVLNSLTGPAIDKSFDVLKPHGRFIEIGKLGIWTPEQAAERRPHAAYHAFDFDELIERNAALVHSTLGPVREWFESGRLHPLPQTVFPVQDAVEAYRFLQRARHVGKVVLSFAAAETPALRADGSYLITGGLGGLGLNLARHMVAQGARHLVLTGRTAGPTEAQETVERLRAAGANISVISADTSKAEEVARMIGACQALAPLRGIVHAAGVLDDGVIDNQTAERFVCVMAPKVRGAWYLHLQTQLLPLDFFVCFSSMASMLGATGQANYAAANAFLDGLAQYRRAAGLPGLSIDWGPWAEAGMAARLSVEDQGVEKIAIEDGLQIFDELVAAQRTGPGQIGVWRANWKVFQKRVPGGELPPFFQSISSPSKGTVEGVQPHKRKDDFLHRFHNTPDSERVTLLESTINSELVEVLRFDGTYEPAPTQAWADLGVDSSMMVEIRNRLEGVFKIPLPVERLVRDINTRGVASFVAEKLAQVGADNMPAVAEEHADEAGSGALSKEEELEKAYQLVARIPQAFITVEKQHGRQVLSAGRWRCDFASCNYLGLDLHPEVMAAIPAALAEWGVHPSWTRAVASPKIYDDLQRELAAFVGAPATLVFPSISLLHVGVLPILAGYDGVILKDTEAHHSLHEGCIRAQANGAEWVNFPHSDIDDLGRKLARYPAGRTKIIATDGVYSMGSSHPPLVEYVRLAKTYNALLYVDDAHGFGIIGERPDMTLPYGYRGNGMVRHFGLDYVADRIVYVAGMSKSFSSYAAFVTCFDEKMKANLESAGPFVFSGPTCTASLASALAGLHVNAREGDPKRQYIYRLTRRFVEAVRAIGFEVDNGGFFPIVGVVMGNFDDFAAACQRLWEHDILITPAMYPAVPIDRNLVRFSITAANTEDEVDRAIRALEAVWHKIRGAQGQAARVSRVPQM